MWSFYGLEASVNCNGCHLPSIVDGACCTNSVSSMWKLSPMGSREYCNGYFQHMQCWVTRSLWYTEDILLVYLLVFNLIIMLSSIFANVEMTSVPTLSHPASTSCEFRATAVHKSSWSVTNTQIHPSIPPLSSAYPALQQAEQGVPNIPLSLNEFHLLLGDPDI